MTWLVGLALIGILLTGCTRIQILIEIVVPRAAITYVASATGNDAAGTPCTDAQPCSVRRGLITMSCTNNDVLELLGDPATPSIYQGANYMLDLQTHVPGKSGTGAGARCAVRARSDGGVVIDGQFARNPLRLEGHSWWTFQGFDVANGFVHTNAGGHIVSIGDGGTMSTSVEFKRICAYDAAPQLAGKNGHFWNINAAQNSLFEDLCGFGIGARNVFVTDSSGGGNTFRRIWARHDGYKGDNVPPGDLNARPCQAAVVQFGYHSNEPYTSTYENIIVIHSYDRLPTNDPCYSTTAPTSGSNEWFFSGQWGQKMLGIIGYTASPLFFPVNNAGWQYAPLCNIDNAKTLTDIFIDTRNMKIGPVNFTGQAGACITATRVTGLKTTAAAGDTWSPNGNTSLYAGGTYTNTQDCTTPGACPDFYTGTLGGASGARNCYEYSGGVLGSVTATQGLWPWRMDNRIKAAIARAGKTALAGGAGAGYLAGTVTSEIVSRYGAVPAACNRTGTAFVPDFHVAVDFPSTAVLDTFDRANGPLGGNWTYINGTSGLDIVGNQVSASTAGVPRVLWTAAQMTPQQEVYGTWITVPPDGAGSILALFGATTTDDATGWQLILDRQTSANDRLKIARITGGYTEIWGPIDLGSEVVDGNSFGVRVSALQTISVYWKYNGITYRVGSVIDTNLPTGSTMSYIGMGGGNVAGAVINDFGGGSTGGVAPNPGNIGRFGSRFPTQ